MLEKIKKLIINGWLSNLIRHALTALGAILIAQGLPQDVVLPFVDAAINLLLQALPIIISLIWSLLEKKTLQAATKSQ